MQGALIVLKIQSNNFTYLELKLSSTYLKLNSTYLEYILLKWNLIQPILNLIIQR